MRKVVAFVLALGCVVALAGCVGLMSGDNRHNVPLSSGIQAQIKSIGSTPGKAMFVRIFKQEGQLEVWKETSGGDFRLLKTYAICAWSGDLGPKIREGDRQAPEGVYTITPGLMHPRSNYYLAFNIGFPNKFDRAHGRTGSNLMVHGDCSSAGCYAMTDGGIAEIYALARESFKGGNKSFQVQVFPFRMTPQNIAANIDNQHMPFWRDIKEGYDLFEINRQPPTWDVCERQYVFNASGGGMLDALGPCPAQTRSATLVARMEADERKINDILGGIAEKQAEQQAIAARGEAINTAVGGFFSSIGNAFAQ
ncbi:L,D-transpeptidase family protein [Devosia pacifica]|uniref:L,D-transpeptidase family protein n=1 Tax=Devosia pacifica TaxID=1335967 RepID=UPI00167B15F6|nr:murein L,D-transpeptidase family protein [Devosia pacifica]